MNKTTLLAGAALCLLFAGIAASEQHRADAKDADMNPCPASAFEKATSTKIGHLDDAAEAAQKAGDYAEAEADASQSVSLDIASGRGRDILAAALDAQGKTQEALQAYKAIHDGGDVNPANELPYARLLLETGHWAQAVEAYNKQLPYLSNGELIPAHSDFSPNIPHQTDLAAAIHIGLGLTTGWRGYRGDYPERYQQAQEEFRQAAALEPNSALANYHIGYGLNRMGRRAEAQKAFQKAAAAALARRGFIVP